MPGVATLCQITDEIHPHTQVDVSDVVVEEKPFMDWIVPTRTKRVCYSHSGGGFDLTHVSMYIQVFTYFCFHSMNV